MQISAVGTHWQFVTQTEMGALSELGADVMPTLLNIFGQEAASSQFVRIDSEECVLAADAEDAQAASTVIQPSPTKKPNRRKAATATKERTTDVLPNQHKRNRKNCEIRDLLMLLWFAAALLNTPLPVCRLVAFGVIS